MDANATAGGIGRITAGTDVRNTLDLETTHCPVCMAAPEYCPGHADDDRYPGTMVPQPAMQRAVFGRGGYGRFDGDPVTRWAPDGTRMILLEPFSYVDRSYDVWTAPKGTVLDGASIPRPFWTLVGSPYRGKYRYASIVHDWECIDRSKDWRSVHRMFHDACLCGGCTASHAKLLFYAVYHFGPRWGFEEAKVSRGSKDVTSSDVALVRRFIEDDDPDFRRMVETNPRELGVNQRYGRRGFYHNVPPKLGPEE